MTATLAPELVRDHPDLARVFERRDIYDAEYRKRMRNDFGFFRQHMRPRMQWGWWNEVVATELTEFYKDFVAGKRPKLAICSPPQHGKSWTALDFVAWVSGHNPNLRTIFASFSDELGMRTNKDLQRAFDDDRFKMLFPNTRLGTRGDNWQRNASILEFAGHVGSGKSGMVMSDDGSAPRDLPPQMNSTSPQQQAVEHAIRIVVQTMLTGIIGHTREIPPAVVLSLVSWNCGQAIGNVLAGDLPTVFNAKKAIKDAFSDGAR